MRTERAPTTYPQMDYISRDALRHIGFSNASIPRPGSLRGVRGRGARDGRGMTRGGVGGSRRWWRRPRRCRCLWTGVECGCRGLPRNWYERTRCWR
ncbi:hypothetical protein U0070_001189 [Myodes glareolus]|uniref:DUF1127 domain-containing protein n=1 Tax=Myodes glareolus TaxID=447135 RepID=A0AAW0HJP8_MYOGA